MAFHEDTLMRRLCVGGPPRQRRYDDGQGSPAPKPNPLNSTRKPYVYGASPLKLRLPVLRWYYNHNTK